VPTPSSSQGTCINLHLPAHVYNNDPISNCLAPCSLPPPTLPFQTASTFFITGQFPFNTVELPLGQTLESCPLSSATLIKHTEIMRINMAFFSLHVSFPSCPLSSNGFMQSFRLSVVLCLILSLVSLDLLSHSLHCWC